MPTNVIYFIFLFFLVPVCVGMGANIVECVKRGDKNCFEALPPDISSQQGCEAACMAANSYVAPPPQVTCVFFVWSATQVHFLNWAKKNACAAHGCCRQYDIFLGELNILHILS